MKRLLALCLLLAFAVSVLAACPAKEPEHIDYAGQVQLDMNSNRARVEATIRTLVDGDTTHFYVPESVSETGVLKARYLAINTPETTGKIEPWGKKAAALTAEKLSGATSIIIESDTATWNLDSTGERFLVWVWYKSEGSDTYRNLNIEILQSGLAVASNSAENVYGETCLAAIAQAERETLYVHNKTQKDPDYPKGDAIPLSLRELRANIADYAGQRVTFEGVVTKHENGSNGVYVEAFDTETNMYNGVYVYYAYGLPGEGLEILTIGNRVRIVGVVSEHYGSYQITDISYRVMKPNDPNNILKLDEEFHPAAYSLIRPELFLDGKVNVPMGDEEVEVHSWASMSVAATVEMRNLLVKSVHTTSDPASSSVGAMTLTCEAGGHTITVRTAVLYDENGKLVTADVLNGQTIDVKGIVSYYENDSEYNPNPGFPYQIKVLMFSDITIH